jgi:hypothetical protein
VLIEALGPLFTFMIAIGLGVILHVADTLFWRWWRDRKKGQRRG